MTEIVLIGECTNQNGPYADDWFLVLVRRDGQWSEISMYSDGEPLRTGLANSTDFASRIIWPPALAERPVFTYQRVTGQGLLYRLRRFFVPEMAEYLSQDALSSIPR